MTSSYRVEILYFHTKLWKWRSKFYTFNQNCEKRGSQIRNSNFRKRGLYSAPPPPAFFPPYWPFVRGIHRSLVNSPLKGQWRGALMLSFMCTWTNGWVDNRNSSDLRHYRAHYDVTVMAIPSVGLNNTIPKHICYFKRTTYQLLRITLVCQTNESRWVTTVYTYHMDELLSHPYQIALEIMSHGWDSKSSEWTITTVAMPYGWASQSSVWHSDTVKPVYNDHPMGYLSAFWSSSRWPRAT